MQNEMERKQTDRITGSVGFEEVWEGGGMPSSRESWGQCQYCRESRPLCLFVTFGHYRALVLGTPGIRVARSLVLFRINFRLCSSKTSLWVIAFVISYSGGNSPRVYPYFGGSITREWGFLFGGRRYRFGLAAKPFRCYKNIRSDGSHIYHPTPFCLFEYYHFSK